MADMTYIILSALFAALSVTLLLIFITMPSRKKARALIGSNASASDIISGTIPDGVGGADCDDMNNGFRIKVDKKGLVTFIPNGTISHHAMRRTLET